MQPRNDMKTSGNTQSSSNMGTSHNIQTSHDVQTPQIMQNCHDMRIPHNMPPPYTFLDTLVGLANCWYLTKYSDQFSNFAFANIYRDAFQFASHFADGQHFKVYGRVSSRFKYHILQRFHNSVRKFDVVDLLAEQMSNYGNAAFYYALSGEVNGGGSPFNHETDLQRLDGIGELNASGLYLYNQIFKIKGRQAAELAREMYMRGFSRVIDVADHGDWQTFRGELLASEHVGAVPGSSEVDDAMLFAISYKGSSVKITRRMHLLNDDGTRDDREGILLQESKEMTSDIVNDFRWSQIVRSCMTMAAETGKSKVRIWLDRLVMMGKPMEERERIYEILDWEDFGLYAYAVCPVVRVYDQSEVEFGTDFWRKLETVMGVAGRGLVVDDYMLRQYDRSIYYSPSLYSRQLNGLSVIGGGGVYIRGVTLAVATAVLTDAVTVAQANEDMRTVDSIGGWKAWALRTIAEGAYSANHSFMMVKQAPFDITLRNFQIIAFWESLVCQSAFLTGNSYMDMSVLKSTQYRKSSRWDGVTEWVGMMARGCEVQDRGAIMQFLAEHVNVELYATTTGHVAAMLSLTAAWGKQKRTLVVDLARYSTATNGQVTAVAEATGLWNGSILPGFYEYVPDPDVNQSAEIGDDGVVFKYQQMAVQRKSRRFGVWSSAVVAIVISIVAGVLAPISLAVSVPVAFLLVWTAVRFELGDRRQWPWVDLTGVGEALFDNLLMHGLYAAGIKKQYRRLISRRYDQLGWI